MNFENSPRFLTYGTGIEYTSEGLEKILGEFIERDYKLNRKFGLKREDDTLPGDFLKKHYFEG